MHCRDLARVPARQVAAGEFASGQEHVSHIPHGPDVPPGQVAVEVGLEGKQGLHVRHQRHVPLGHLERPRRAAVHVWSGAARHAGGIAVGGIQAAIDRSLERGFVRKRTHRVTRGWVVSRRSDSAAAARHAPTGQHSLVHQARLMDPLADRAGGSCSVAALDSIEPRGGAGKHPGGGGQRGGGPAGDILVEGCGSFEHGIHHRHLRGIPRADILVERGGVTEHVSHVRDLRRIPRANGSVEGPGVIKHAAHARDLPCIP